MGFPAQKSQGNTVQILMVFGRPFQNGTGATVPAAVRGDTRGQEPAGIPPGPRESPSPAGAAGGNVSSDLREQKGTLGWKSSRTFELNERPEHSTECLQ